MKKQYLVINANDSFDYYIVDELESLIREMYEPELENGSSLEEATGWLKNNYSIFEVHGTIVPFG
jgi:anthranilate/para-aminobenzoate synthase component II